MHPYVHVFQAAVDCAWETKSDWDTFRTLAETVSRVAKESGFTEYEDIVALPLGHDSPGEVAQPEGKVLDWSKGECEPIPGKTMPNLVHVKRNYSQIFEKFIAWDLTSKTKWGLMAWRGMYLMNIKHCTHKMVQSIIQNSFLMAVQAFTNVRKLVMLY